MKKKYSFEAHLTWLSLISSVPLLVFLILALIHEKVSPSLIVLTALIGGLLIAYTSHHIYQKLGYQFRSLNNILDGLTQGDYGLRARSIQGNGALGELIVSINGLATRLSEQRIESVENQLLVHTIIEHIDVAIVALTEDNRISFINPAAKKMLQLEGLALSAELQEQLGDMKSFSNDGHQLVELSLGHHKGRFNIHVEEFRQLGLQHKLLFITDVSTLLRSEERKAWQSLVRVISHEINNSLSPIASISQTLIRLIHRQESVIENSRDIIEGLTIIGERAKGIGEFVGSYKQLAKLPEPQKKRVSIQRLFEKICFLFTEHTIIIESENDVELSIDPIQFEQVLINLIKNAVESMEKSKPQGVIKISWQVVMPYFRLVISDQGAGIGNSDNLFVPFYSTKKHGSGIGLVLCRQIIEAHNGRLAIKNRNGAPGCDVTIEIPYSPIGDN